MASNSQDGFARQSLESRISLLKESQQIMVNNQKQLEARVSSLEESNHQLAATIHNRPAFATEFEAMKRKLHHVEKSAELAAAIKIGAASSTELVNQISAGSESLHHQRFNAIEERLAKLEEEIHDFRRDAAGTQGLSQLHEQWQGVGLEVTEAQQSSDDPVAVPPLPRDQLPDGNSKQSSRVSQVYTRRGSYTLENSVWDAAILIGLPEMGSLGSVFMTWCLLSNSLMQVLLCLLINDLFSRSAFNEASVRYMTRWRVFYGHSLGAMNDFTLQPTVRAVCLQVPGMSQMTEAAEMYGQISEYLPTKDYYENQEPFVGPLLPHLANIGEILTVIALVIWVMTLAHDVSNLLAYVGAIRSLPLSERTEIVHSEDTSHLKCVTLVRKCGAYLVAMIRLFVLFLLGFSGTLYILHTIELRDILLNCSALAIVLSLDELWFNFMPSPPKLLLQSLEPLPAWKIKTYKGVSVHSVLEVALLISVLLLSRIKLAQQKGILQDIRNEICGGKTDFVVALDAAGIVNAAQAPALPKVESKYYFEAIRQLIAGNEGFIDRPLSMEKMSGYAPAIIGGEDSLQAWTNVEQQKTIGYYNSMCIDMLPAVTSPYPWAAHFLRQLRDETDDGSVSDCDQVRMFCNQKSAQGAIVRTICPATCSCNDPVIGGLNGCPPACKDLITYNTSMRELRVQRP